MSHERPNWRKCIGKMVTLRTDVMPFSRKQQYPDAMLNGMSKITMVSGYRLRIECEGVSRWVDDEDVELVTTQPMF
jgi:hypothetical protein